MELIDYEKYHDKIVNVIRLKDDVSI